jgi:hypothetical protein
MNSPEKNQFINIEEGTDGLRRAIRVVKAHNRTLVAAGYTDEQIVGIFNNAIKECGDELAVDNFLDGPVAALQSEVDRLNRQETSGAR